MSRQQLTLELAAADVPRAEALLELAGAEMLALRDSSDEPVLEPEPNTAPLWPNVTLRAVFPGDLDLGPLAELLRASCAAKNVAVAALTEADWEAGLRQVCKARPIGQRLWLAPATDESSPPGRIVVRLNMGLAFGTGEHPTTALCLDWLEANPLDGVTILDYGCGSGVLAIAALALGASRASAVDTDAQALLATRANAALNGVAERLFVGAPEALPAVTVDVLLANILAGPLIELAATLAARVRVGGRLVLSGVLEAQAADVVAAYAPYFTGFEQATREGWVRVSARRKPG